MQKKEKLLKLEILKSAICRRGWITFFQGVNATPMTPGRFGTFKSGTEK